MTAVRNRQLPDWLRLAFSAPESDLDDPGQQQAWLAFIRETAEELNPAFGIIDYDYDSLYGETAVEIAVKESWMLQTQRIPLSREVLRGYDWLTICPQELADRLGGVFRALAPVLPVGEPVLFDERQAEQGRDYRIVYHDASGIQPADQ